MRVVVQRVSHAKVTIGDTTNGEIGAGICVFVAVEGADSRETMQWMAGKLINLRIFPDDDGKMNRSVSDIGGGILIISNFTLYGDARKGTRPSYTGSAAPHIALPIYDDFVKIMRETAELQIETGIFGEMMQVEIINDGPVTLIIDK